jgi:hypothetical protein
MPPDTETSWPLHGFWLAWYWISAAIAAVLVVAGAAMAVLSGLTPQPVRAVLLLNAVLLLVVGTVIGRQVATTALDVRLTHDGTLEVRRPHRTLRTAAGRVLRVRASACASGSRTPTVIETEDGFTRLIHPRPQIDELIAALRRYNPDLRIER